MRSLLLLAMVLGLGPLCPAAEAKTVDLAAQLKEVDARLAELEAKLKAQTDEVKKTGQKIADVSYAIVRGKDRSERQAAQIEETQRAQAEEKRKATVLADEVKADQAKQVKFDETIKRLRTQNQSLGMSLELARYALNELKPVTPDAGKDKGDK